MTPGLREVFASYRPKFRHELRTEWAVALLYRPVSLLLTPLFIRLGLLPGAVLFSFNLMRLKE